jgi:hypothetical protein
MVADHQGCKHQGGIVVRLMAEIRFARGQRLDLERLQLSDRQTSPTASNKTSNAKTGLRA